MDNFVARSQLGSSELCTVPPPSVSGEEYLTGNFVPRREVHALYALRPHTPHTLIANRPPHTGDHDHGHTEDHGHAEPRPH